MNNTRNDMILSGPNIELTEDLKAFVEEKSQKLFDHESHIIRLRIELEHDNNVSPDKQYVAKGRIEIRGNDLIAAAESGEIHKSVDALCEKLDRMLRRRSRLRRVKRKQTNHVDIPAELPKVANA